MVTQRQSDPLVDMLFGVSPDSGQPTSQEARMAAQAGVAPNLLLDSLFPPAAPVAPAAPPAEPGIFSEFGGGVGSGVQTLVSSAQGLGAVTAFALGAEETGEEWARLAAMTEEEAFREYPRAIERIEDVSSPGEFALWFSRTLGEQVPIVASILLGGGAGGLLGRAVGRGVLSLPQAEMWLAGAGAIGTATGIETGATTNELFQATGEIHPRASFIAGIIKGSLEAAVPAFLGARLGLTPDLTGGLINSVIKTFDRVIPTRLATAFSIGVGESITELLQESVDVGTRSFVDANYDALGPEAASRLLNAAAAGGMVGLFFGGLAGGPSPQRQQRVATGDTEPDAVDANAFSFRDGLRAETALASGTLATIEKPKITGLPEVPSIDETQRAVLEAGATEIPDEFLSNKIAVLPTGDSFARLRYPVFRDARETQTEAAFAPSRGGATVRIDVRNLTEDDISTELRSLPDKLDINDPRIRLLNPEKADEALEYVELALESRREGVAALFDNKQYVFAPGQGYLENAEQMYEIALDRGFRYVPEEQDGFVLARTPTLEEIKVEGLSATAVDPSKNDTFTYILPFESKAIHWKTATAGFVPVTDRARRKFGEMMNAASTNDQESAPALDYHTSRAVMLDKNKLKKEDLVEFEPEFFFTSILGEKIDLEVQTGAELVQALENEYGYSLTDEADPERVLRWLKGALRTFKSGEGALHVARDEYSNAIRLGFRPRVLDDISNSVVFVGSSSALQNAIVMEVPQAPAARRRTPSEPFWNPDEGNIKITTRAEQFNWKTVDGAPYSLEDHKPGTAVLLDSDVKRMSPFDKKVMREVLRYYNAWMKRFGIKAKLILHGRDLGTESWLVAEGSKFSGHLVPVSSDVQIIAINLRANIETFANAGGKKGKRLRPWAHVTATHEFGHFIAFTELLKAPEAVQDRILSAYNRALIKGTLGGEYAIHSTFAGPPREAFDYSRGIFSEGRMRDEVRLGPDYWFSFDEWFANQVQRYVLSLEKEPIDPLERFFKRVARKVRDAYKSIFGKYGEQYDPEPEVFEYLEEMRLRTATKEQLAADGNLTPEEIELHSPMVVGMAMADEKGKIENFKTLQGSLPSADPFKAPSRSPFSSRMKGLFDKFGLKDKRFDETLADLDYFNAIVKYGFNIFQLADKNKHIPELQRYKELVDQWWVYKMGIISRADGRTKEWLAIGKDHGDRLAQFLFALDQMEYLSKKEREDGVARWPNDAEMAALVKKYKIEPEVFALYEKIRDDFNFILDEIEETAILDLKRTAADQIQIDLESVEIRKEFDELRQRPYFPHSRFGDYAVVIKSMAKGKKQEQTVYMEQFKTERAAERASAELRKRYPAGAYNVAVRAIPKEAQPFRGLPPSLLKAIRNRLNLSEQQKIWLDQMLVEYLPSQSFRKRLMKRENIPGYSLDAMRSYANYFFHGANYFARIRYFDVLQDQINDLRESTSMMAQGLVNVASRDKIREFMQDHFNYIMNPGRDWAQLRSLAFQWWLGFSVASAAVNFTQIPLVTWPYLASRFGDIRAFNAIRRATFAWQNVYKNKTKGISDEEFAAIERGIREGFLDESQATELANVSEGGNLQRLMPGTKAQRMLMWSANLSAFFFQTSEKINRRITFRAAYALAKANPEAKYLSELIQTEKLEYGKLIREGLSDIEAKAFLAGKDAVRRTQFEYAQHARPKFMQGKRGTILTFFMFTQNMLYFAAHSPGAARYLLLLLLAAGLMGFPGAEDLASLARFMARNLLGRDFDLDKELREFIIELADGDISPDLILHGGSRVGFGIPDAADKLGIPIPKFDLSPNIGMGQIIPGVAELGRPGLSFEERFSNISTDIAGAAFGIGINMMKFLSDDSLPLDDAKRWERAIPRAMRNLVRSARYLEEGRERTRTGATVVEFDASDPQQLSEIIAQGLGFTPTRVSRQWNRISMQREAAAFWETRKGMLLAQYDHAYTVGGKEALVDVRRAIRRYNQEVPFSQLRITGKTLSDSRKERRRRRRLFERGIPQKRAERALYRDIERLTPEVEEAVEIDDVTGLR